MFFSLAFSLQKRFEVKLTIVTTEGFPQILFIKLLAGGCALAIVLIAKLVQINARHFKFNKSPIFFAILKIGKKPFPRFPMFISLGHTLKNVYYLWYASFLSYLVSLLFSF